VTRHNLRHVEHGARRQAKQALRVATPVDAPDDDAAQAQGKKTR
jgi:hypothetical protein